MKYLASYCLLALSGKENINEKDLLAVLKAIHAEAKEEVAAQVCKQLAGKNITELCQQGQSKISCMTASAGPATQATGAAPVKQEAKKEEKAKTVEEEEDVDIGDLFG
jgi:ribosomal protein L12E/L44/L45/RPP1/RPP2